MICRETPDGVRRHLEEIRILKAKRIGERYHHANHYSIIALLWYGIEQNYIERVETTLSFQSDTLYNEVLC